MGKGIEGMDNKTRVQCKKTKEQAPTTVCQKGKMATTTKSQSFNLNGNL